MNVRHQVNIIHKQYTLYISQNFPLYTFYVFTYIFALYSYILYNKYFPIFITSFLSYSKGFPSV